MENKIMSCKYKSSNITFSIEDYKKHLQNSGESPQDNKVIETQFNKLIRDEIFNFMGRFENIILLAGAGASVVSDKENKVNEKFGQTVKMLGNAVIEELKNDRNCYTKDQLSKQCKYEHDDENFNLEDFLSCMQFYLEFESFGKRSKFKRSYDKILKTIKNKTSYNYNDEYFKHAKLIKQLTDIHTSPNRLSIVTTNYDTIIEDSADSLGYTVFDGFTFSHSPEFEIDMFDWYLSKPIAEVKSQKEAYKKTVINLLKIHGSLTWERIDGTIVRKNKKEIKEPIMIFPSSHKYMQSYQKPYFELFSKFQELLRKPNTILITAGFSFADNHISQMIIQALKTVPSLSLLVTDFDISPSESNENWQELESLMEKDYSIAFLEATMNTDLTDFFIGGYKND